MQENTIKERLTDFLKHENISKSEFGRRIGVSNAFVSSLKKSISPDKLQLIREQFPALNLEWLQFGTGDMLNREETQRDDELLRALHNAQAQNAKSQEQIDRLLGIIEAFQKQ